MSDADADALHAEFPTDSTVRFRTSLDEPEVLFIDFDLQPGGDAMSLRLSFAEAHKLGLRICAAVRVARGEVPAPRPGKGKAN